MRTTTLVLIALLSSLPGSLPAGAASVEVEYDIVEYSAGIPDLGLGFGPLVPSGGLARRVHWRVDAGGAIATGPVQWSYYYNGGYLFAYQLGLSFNTPGGDRIVGTLGVNLSTAIGTLAGSLFQLGSLYGYRSGQLRCAADAGGGACAGLGLRQGPAVPITQTLSPFPNPMQGRLRDGTTGFELSGTAGAINGHPVTFSVVGQEVARLSDLDDDGTPDASDNCLEVANGSILPDAGDNVQLDADADGFGNVCDCDFNDDLACGQPDYSIFLVCFSETLPGTGPADDPGCAESDMNGDGAVGQPDYSLFLSGFLGAPGP